MTIPSYVQVPPDSTGKKLETTKIKTGGPDDSEYERQRMDVPDLGPQVNDFLRLILIELRVQSVLQASAFETIADLDSLRDSMGDQL